MASDDIPPTPYVYGWALATYHLAISPGTLVCGSWLVSLSCPQLRCGFIRWTLSLSLLDETRNHYTRTRSVVSLTLSAPGPHIITTHMYAHRPSPGVPWFPVSSVLVVTRYCLTLSRFPFLVFPCLVFSSILGDYTRVWVLPVPCSLFPFSVFLFSMSRREAVEERNTV